MTIYRFFSESEVQVGVYSTAIYEGLKFDLDTYLYDLLGLEIMDDLVENGYATVVDSTEELFQEISVPKDVRVDTKKIFKPNAVDNIIEELEKIRLEKKSL